MKEKVGKTTKYYGVLPLSKNNDRSQTAAYCPLDLQEGYNARVDPLPWSASIVYGTAGFKTTQTPPTVAARNIQGPLLFKCCRVDYNNKKNNRLEIPKGEYIGKIVHCTRNTDSTPKAEDSEYDDIIVNSSLDEIDSQGETSIHIIKRT